MRDEVGANLGRHLSGDWGLVDEMQREANNRAVDDGSEIRSAYLVGKLMVVIETDARGPQGFRKRTRLMLADEM